MILLEEVDAYFGELVKEDPATAEQVTAAIDKLKADGPSLGRPLVDRIRGSNIHALKELRPGCGGGSEVRILFVFDPQRPRGGVYFLRCTTGERLKSLRPLWREFCAASDVPWIANIWQQWARRLVTTSLG